MSNGWVLKTLSTFHTLLDNSTDKTAGERLLQTARSITVYGDKTIVFDKNWKVFGSVTNDVMLETMWLVDGKRYRVDAINFQDYFSRGGVFTGAMWHYHNVICVHADFNHFNPLFLIFWYTYIIIIIFPFSPVVNRLDDLRSVLISLCCGQVPLI